MHLFPKGVKIFNEKLMNSIDSPFPRISCTFQTFQSSVAAHCPWRLTGEKIFLCYTYRRLVGTAMSTKLAILFAAGSDVGLKAISEQVSQQYGIGYAGLYDCDGHRAVYLQAADKKIRMAPRKLQKMCRRFGEIKSVEKYQERDGDMIEEVGTFRTRGRQSKDESMKVTTNIHGDHNTVHQHIDRSVTNNITNVDNSVIHLHIHALGEEDLSHISLERLKEVIMSREENINVTKNSLEQKLSEAAYAARVHRLWEKNRRIKRHKRMNTEPVLMSDCSDDEGDLILKGEPVEYDSDLDSEYNKETKRRTEELSLLEESAKYRGFTIPHEVASLLFENPHNSNVIASTKSGDIKYFNGISWVKISTDELDQIVENWIQKTRQTVEMFKNHSDSDFAQSNEAQYVTNVLDMLEDGVTVHVNEQKGCSKFAKKRSLICIENMNMRLKGVESVTGRRVKRVSGREPGLQNIVRNTTWDELESG